MKNQNVDSAKHNKKNTRRIGIIAGRGNLPIALATLLRADGEDPFLLLVEGEADPKQYEQFQYQTIKIAKVGQFLKVLSNENCTHITLAGPVDRPDFKKLIPDFEGIKLIAKITGSLNKGDDGLMTAITSYIKDKGFEVVGAHELTGSMSIGKHLLGTVEPSEQDRLDIKEGIRIVKGIGELDIGQAAIIREGYVLAVEAAEGTDGLLKRVKDFSWEVPAGVLVKLSKPGQDIQADMPTIGPDTITEAIDANLRGIAVEAGLTLVLDKEESIRRANAGGIFILGISDSFQV
jgi:UDP-2,3-diacylglucosamine hydrolase